MWAKNKQQSGFTIVELLIVIVVIGILAAITIVSFNGVQNRARLAALQSDLESAAKILETNKYSVAATSGTEGYPAAASATDFSGLTAAGVKLSSGSSMTTYIVNNATSPANYCLTITNNSLAYSATSKSGSSMPGTCVTNLAQNPSAENDINYYQAYNGAPMTSVLAGCYSGSRCISYDISGGANKGLIFQLASPLIVGQPYVYSAYAKGVSGLVASTSYRPTNSSSAYLGEGSAGTVSTLNGSWQRLSTAAVLVSSGSDYGGFQVNIGTASPSLLYIDALMVTQGTSLYSFGDGNSTGWFWNGTPNSSTSTGPSA